MKRLDVICRCVIVVIYPKNEQYNFGSTDFGVDVKI